MNSNRRFSNVLRCTGGAVSLTALLVGFYGCSSSSKSGPPSAVNDAGPDGTAGDAASSTDASDGGTSAILDTGLSDADAGALSASDADAATSIAQKVNVTYLFEDTADAGLTDSGTVKVDPNLVNPWGLAFSTSGVAWISDNGTNKLSTYTPVALGPITVAVPVSPADDSGAPVAGPSGQIFNSTSDFLGDKFIVSTEEGTLFGWQPAPADGGPGGPGIRFDGVAAKTGASFKGLTVIAGTSADGAASNVLLAADFHNGVIDAFDATYAPIASDGGIAWVNPNLPATDAGATYAPFNLAALTVGTSTKVYVAYAAQDPQKLADSPGPGRGIIGVFNTDGTFVKNLVVGGVLNAPWALALVPESGWGGFAAGTLLVGNFGDGTIHGFDPTTGVWLGQVFDSSGVALSLPGLWALTLGQNTDAGESSSQLYFTSGPGNESHGLFGYLTVTP